MEFDTNALLPNTDYDDVCHRLLPDSNLALKQRIHRMKCFTCSICSYRSNAHSPRQSYMNNNTVLPSVNCVRDLGVIVDCHLKFDAHISLIVRKAMLRSRLILKCFSSRNKDLMMKAFFTYVRPIFEYCSPVWSPHLKYLIDRIESVQKFFTKRLPGLWNVPYPKRLEL